MRPDASSVETLSMCASNAAGAWTSWRSTDSVIRLSGRKMKCVAAR